MYPSFELFGAISIYTFGITLTLVFFAFLWNLKRLETRFGYSFSFFSQNILWFFLGTFVFSRIFYIVGNWQDLKYITNIFHFFLVGEFKFSLFGAIFGFLGVLYTLVYLEKSQFKKYIDGVVLSFLFILIIGYFGSIFGGQVYGKPTDLPFYMVYTNPNNYLVKYQVGVFPLPIVYTITSILLFFAMHVLSLFVHIKGFIGYVGIIAFCAIIIIFDFFSGKEDLLSLYTPFHFTQLFAFFLATWAGYQLFKIFEEENHLKRI